MDHSIQSWDSVTVQGLLGCEEVVLESLSAAREIVCPLKPCTFISATAQWITDILEALRGLNCIESCQHFNSKRKKYDATEMYASEHYFNEKLSWYPNLDCFHNI